MLRRQTTHFQPRTSYKRGTHVTFREVMWIGIIGTIFILMRFFAFS